MTVERDPIFTQPKTALPYAGTTGFVPVEQSRRVAEQEAASGIVAQRQANILSMLAEAGPIGLTSAEIEQRTGEHHGKVSSALSSMHKDGLIVALKFVRRNGSGAYVLPGHVNGQIVREFVSIADSKADRPPTASPAPSRPRLTSEELELIAKVRAILKTQPDSVVRMFPSTVRALLAALERLNG